MIANFGHNFYFADFLGLENSSFFKKLYKEMMLELLQSAVIICCFYEKYADYRLFMFWQKGIIGVHGINVLLYN